MEAYKREFIEFMVESDKKHQKILETLVFMHVPRFLRKK